MRGTGFVIAVMSYSRQKIAIGILNAGAEAGLLDLPEMLHHLRATSFYVAPILLKRLLEKNALRKMS